MDSSLVPVLPYIIPSVFTIILTTGIVFYVQRYHTAPIARSVAYMCFAAGVWAFARLCGLLSVDENTNLWWGKFEYFGIVAIPIAWLYFALHYTGYSEHATRRNFLILWIVPFITLFLVWTNGRHGLIWSSVYLEQTGEIIAPASNPGPWFWVHTAYSYFVMLGALALVFSYLRRAPGLFRSQSILPTLALLIPYAVNIITLLGWLPKSLDLTSSAFGISALLLLWDISRYRLLSLVPIARRVVFDSILDSVMVLDWQNQLVDINLRAVQMFQIEPAEVVGEPVEIWLEEWTELARFCLAEDFGEAELQLSFRNGETGWFVVQTTPIYGHEPTPNGRLVVLRNITDRKLNEQAMATARDEAMKADKFKTQLLAKVSHELRTPLSVIHSYVELLQLGAYQKNPERQSAALSTIADNTRHLTKLVDDLLDSAQLDSGKLKLDSLPFTPRDLLQTVQSQFAMSAESKHLKLTAELDSTLPTRILGDFHRLRQILANLVDNAIKYSESGDICVRLARHGQDQWMMSVADQGTGIPPESHETIFEPFQVLQGSVQGKNASYGLGLSIVRQLAAMMEGEVLVESEQGKGSTFTIFLPLCVEANLSTKGEEPHAI